MRPPEGVVEDFLLMNPRLPKAARWITVYAIVVRPVLWLLVMLFGALGFESSLGGGYAEAVIDHAVEIFGGLFHLVFVVVVLVGGFKLACPVLRRGAMDQRRSGTRIWAGLVDFHPAADFHAPENRAIA